MGNPGALRWTLRRLVDNRGVWQVLLARERCNFQDWRGGAGGRYCGVFRSRLSLRR
jgi:hypothetical protein